VKLKTVSAQDQALWNQHTQDVTRLRTAAQSVITPPPAVIPPVVRPTNGSDILDLHGLTFEAAHIHTVMHVEQFARCVKSVTVITGKSGSMQEHLPRWLADHAMVRNIQPLNGGGAFRVWFRKHRG
jgi:DNA-nicking Smr family endonuclease